MPKFLIYATSTMTQYVGEVEADNKDDAEAKALDTLEIPSPNLCHQCADWDTGDSEVLVEEVE